jgi:hypothetical protein
MDDSNEELCARWIEVRSTSIMRSAVKCIINEAV